MNKTTYIKITFGFDKNKFGYPNIYRRGKGANLYGAVIHLFRQRGNNKLPPEQREEVISQLKRAVELLEKDKKSKTDTTAEKIG